MFNHYQMASYKDGGRGEGFYDCWGLVRAVLHEQYGKCLLPSFGNVSPDDKQSMTNLAAKLMPVITVCEPAEGTIAAAYMGSLLVHVGVVVGVDKVLHASRKHGICINSYRDFARLSGNVRYYQCR